MEQIVFEELRSGEEQPACKLVEQVFNDLVAGDFEPEGVDEFFRFANADAMAERMRKGGFVLLAKQSGRIVGVLEFAPPERVALLFVSLRKRGIAKALVARAVEKAKRENPDLSRLTVHSSPYAEPAYERMGFRRNGDVTVIHGIRHIPMELPF